MTGEKYTLAADSLAAFFTTFCEPITGVFGGEVEMLSSALASPAKIEIAPGVAMAAAASAAPFSRPRREIPDLFICFAPF